MRTTLSIDDDNAMRLERLRKKREASFKEVVNDAIRMGLDRLEELQPKKSKLSPTRVVDLGAPLFIDAKGQIGALDDDDDRKKLDSG